MRCYLRAASFAVLAFALSLAASGHASAQRVNYASQTPSSVTVFYFSLPAGTQLIFLNEISSAETIAAIPPVSGTGSVTIPYSANFRSRSARMLLAMPSPDPRNSPNVLYPRTIRSRMMSSDQRSPNRSSATLTGQPERRSAVEFPGTRDNLSRSLANCKCHLE